MSLSPSGAGGTTAGCLVPSGGLVMPLVLGMVARRSRVRAVLWLLACWGP